MAKPVIFTIDDDPEVLRGIERDLRREFGKDYRILRADSGPSALEALKELRLRNEAVALLLSDQKMPGMSGVCSFSGSTTSAVSGAPTSSALRRAASTLAA